MDVGGSDVMMESRQRWQGTVGVWCWLNLHSDTRHWALRPVLLEGSVSGMWEWLTEKWIEINRGPSIEGMGRVWERGFSPDGVHLKGVWSSNGWGISSSSTPCPPWATRGIGAWVSFSGQGSGGSHAFGTGPVETRIEEADSVLRDPEWRRNCLTGNEKPKG